MPLERLPICEKAWNRAEHVGYLTCDEDFELFGEGKHKQFHLVQRMDGHGWIIPLAFGCDADYAEAERASGMAVKARVIQVKRAWSTVYLVEELALVK